MRIGVSDYSFFPHIEKTGADYLTVCNLAKDMGYEGIEFIDLKPERQGVKTQQEAAELIRNHCDKIGLDIIAYTIRADFIAAGSAKEAERVKGCVDIAALLGSPHMRHDATRGHEGGWRDAVAKIAPAIRDVTCYAQEKGIRTSTENHGFFLQDAARVEELILQVNHENYGWLVDIGNFACADEDSVYAVTIAAPYAFHVHVKDFLIKPVEADDPGPGWLRSRHGQYLRGTIAGHGAIPIRACMDILKKNGYDGWVSYEFEGMEDNLPALRTALQYIKSVI